MASVASCTFSEREVVVSCAKRNAQCAHRCSRHWAAPTAYGWQFVVHGYREPQLGQSVQFFYLNRNAIGFWSVTAAGTGP